MGDIAASVAQLRGGQRHPGPARQQRAARYGHQGGDLAALRAAAAVRTAGPSTVRANSPSSFGMPHSARPPCCELSLDTQIHGTEQRTRSPHRTGSTTSSSSYASTPPGS